MKYNAIWKCPIIEIMQDCHAPNILPYKTLSKFIKTVDIGDVKDLTEFCMEAGFNPVSGEAKISLTDLQGKNQNAFPGILGM